MADYASVKFRVKLSDAIAIRNDLTAWINSVTASRKAKKAKADSIRRPPQSKLKKSKCK